MVKSRDKPPFYYAHYTQYSIEMEGEAGDPFGPLIKLCKPTSSQELTLLNCPFARESETFPDAFDSLMSPFSPTQTASQPPGIVMVSPPESESDEDSSIDKSTPQENEEFQTPPEHHNLSSSSQEEVQQLRKSKIEGSHDTETMVVDDGCGNNEASVDLGKGGENVGFLETEEIDGGDGVLGDDCWGGEEEVEGIDGIKSELRRFRGFEGELDEPVSKKIRVSGENWDRETQTVSVGETEVTEKVDDDEFINLDSEEIDEGTELHEDKILIDVDSTEEEFEENDGVSENGEMDKNGDRISSGTYDCVRETEKVYCGPEGGVRNPGEEGEVGLNGGEKSAMVNGALVEGSEEGIRENGNYVMRKNGKEVSCSRNIGEIEKFKCQGSGCIDNPGEENGVCLDGGEKSLLTNVRLEVEASEEGVRNYGTDEIQRNGEEDLGRRNIEEIEMFKYRGSGNDVDQNWKEVMRSRRELPLSMREKDDDKGWKKRVGNVDFKNGSWKELLDALAVILGKVDDDSGEVDFLEVAKRRGMTFPQPRWR